MKITKNLFGEKIISPIDSVHSPNPQYGVHIYEEQEKDFEELDTPYTLEEYGIEDAENALEVIDWAKEKAGTRPFIVMVMHPVKNSLGEVFFDNRIIYGTPIDGVII